MTSSLGPKGNGRRKSILDLAPLELDCMNTLWPLGEGTVRQIQQRLAASRPRAYTTIMTIMDRLAHKGVVTRLKAGRAYVYRPNLSAQEARTHAIEQVVEGFFEGSPEALAAHLAGTADVLPSANSRNAGSTTVGFPSFLTPRASGNQETGSSPQMLSSNVEDATEQPAEAADVFPTTRLDESLL